MLEFKHEKVTLEIEGDKGRFSVPCPGNPDVIYHSEFFISPGIGISQQQNVEAAISCMLATMTRGAEQSMRLLHQKWERFNG